MAKKNNVSNLVNPGPMPAEAAAYERKYRAEDALRTLTRADEIKRDSGLMKDVRRLATQQVKAVTKPSGRR